MKYQLIRNATSRLSYAGSVFLLDPAFAKKGTGPSYAGERRSPLVDMPSTMREAGSRTDAVVISHIHSDHFDAAAAEALDKDHPVFCQPSEAGHELLAGFEDVRPLVERGLFRGVTMQRVPARHGTSPEVLADMGEASGIVFSAAGEPTVYWAGDTLWYEAVKHAIDVFMPEVIIVHAGGALWNGELIVMDAAQVIEVCKAAPNAKVIAIHMESCDHCTVTRKSLRETADAAGVSPEQLLIPKDGEEIVILQETAF